MFAGIFLITCWALRWVDWVLRWVDWGLCWVDWGVTLGSLGFVLVVAFGLRGFLDTNMLVSVMQNRRIGDLNQREAPTQMGLHSGGI